MDQEMTLSSYHQAAEALDAQILPLLQRRLDLAGAFARQTPPGRMPIQDRAWERRLLSGVDTDVNSGMFLRLMYRDMMETASAYQRIMADAGEDTLPHECHEVFPRAATVACQGVEGAYSQAAADRVFPFADITYTNTFEGVFEAVESGRCRFGVLPVENSAHGSVVQNFDLMRRHRFSIARAMKLHVNHCLLGLPGATLEGIKTVVSHEQAVGQCSAFLKERGLDTRLCRNTAMAAMQVAKGGDPSVAAIAQESCAALYGLKVLKQRLQNTDNNYTRFIVIEKDPVVFPGGSKISILFSTAHESGALERVMARFSCLGLNLTKLESRPEEGSDFHYVFYADFQASVEDADVRRLLCSLQRDLPLFTFLGAYQEV